jgi:hypothetical protein
LRYKLTFLTAVLSLWFASASLAQNAELPVDKVFAACLEMKTWDQHYSATSLKIVPDLAAKPTVDDLAPHVSGVWINRVNFNLWRNAPAVAVAQYNNIIHGYIDEANLNNVPRYKFVGENWTTDIQAKTARPLIIKAFAEWASLKAGTSLISKQKLKTGLGFILVEPTIAVPNPEAEIEIDWSPLTNLAGNFNRSINPQGTSDKLQVTFNSTNRWWFGSAATTPKDMMHFYSSALHELGHAVGLWESCDRSSVMIHHRDAGPNGPAFDKIDENSKKAVYDLYSIPAEEPAKAPATSRH